MLAPIVITARFILGIIFLLSGLEKVSSKISVVENIKEYRLLSNAQSKVFARVLPFIEILIGILFLTGIALQITALFATFLLLVFTFAILINLFRKRRFNCHCFSSSKAMIGPMIVIRNLLLIIIAIFLKIQPFSPISVSSIFRQWQLDIRLISQPNSLAPIIAMMALFFGILSLLNESDTLLSSKAR